MMTLRSTMAFSRVDRCVIRMLIAASCVGGSGLSFAHAQQLQMPPSVGITFKTNSLPENTSKPTTEQANSSAIPVVSLPSILPIPAVSSGNNGEVALTAGSDSSRRTANPAEGKTQVRFIGDNDEMNEPARMPSLPLPAQSPSSKTSEASVPQGALKFSLGDEGVVDHGVQKTLNAPQLTQRSPELVKPSRQAPARVVAVASSKDPAFASPQPLPSPPRSGQSSPVASTTVSQEIDLGFVPAPSIPNGTHSNGSISLGANRPGAAAPILATDSRNSDAVRAASTPDVERVLDLEILDTYTVDVPFVIASATAKNNDVCNVFFHGKTVTVVGGKPGKTVVEIRSANNERRLVSFRIVPNGQRQSGPKSDLDKVMEMVAEHFPTAHLRFNQTETGGIQLRGTVGSEADARKILELVRKVCLVPVEDKVQVIR